MKKHLGSTIALGFGVLYGVSGLLARIGTSNTGPKEGLEGGIIAILGALAYRSAKKRKLGEVRTSSLRKASEVFAFVIIAIVLLQKNFPDNVIDNPIPNLLIPLWAIIAYIVIALKKQKGEKKEPNESIQPMADNHP